MLGDGGLADEHDHGPIGLDDAIKLHPEAPEGMPEVTPGPDDAVDARVGDRRGRRKRRHQALEVRCGVGTDELGELWSHVHHLSQRTIAGEHACESIAYRFLQVWLGHFAKYPASPRATYPQKQESWQ